MSLLEQLKTRNIPAILDACSRINLHDKAQAMQHLEYRGYLEMPAGKEHYQLIAAIASMFPGQTVYDIGTHFGNSSLALSYAPVNVISYDIVNVRRMSSLPENVEYKLGDFRFESNLLHSPFIFIDVDPHDGIQEKEFHEFFLDVRYKGITLWDDIHVNDEMKSWWNSVKVPKVDLTFVGHASGTGMILYGDNH